MATLSLSESNGWATPPKHTQAWLSRWLDSHIELKIQPLKLDPFGWTIMGLCQDSKLDWVNIYELWRTKKIAHNFPSITT